MKNRKIVIAVLAFTMLFSSCATAPKAVKEEAKTLDSVAAEKSKTTVKKDQTEYLTLDEIRKEISSGEKSTKNVIAKHVLISDKSQAMPSYKISTHNESALNKLKPLFKYLCNIDYSISSPLFNYTKRGNWVNVNDKDEGKEAESLIAYLGDSDKKNKLIYHDAGDAGYHYENGDYKYYYMDIFENAKRYRLNVGDTLDDKSYKMVDGDVWKVKDAAKFAQNFVDKYFTPLEKSEFTYFMTDFRVKKLGNSYGYMCSFQRRDKSGNLFDNQGYYANVELSGCDRKTGKSDDWITRKLPFLYESNIDVFIGEKNKITNFSKSNTPNVKKITNKGEKLLSLKSAMNKISGDMASQITYKFDTAELEYYYVATTDPDYNKTLGTSPNDQNALLNKDVCEARPYWAFTMESCYPEGNGSFQNFQPVHEGMLYLVDAITGKLSIF